MTDAPERIWAWQWRLPYPARIEGSRAWEEYQPGWKEEADRQGVAEYVRADLLEAQAALIAEAREALRPFAKDAPQWSSFTMDEPLVEPWPDGPASELAVSDLFRAAAVFAKLDNT